MQHARVQVWGTDNRLFEAGGKLRVQYETMVAPRALREFDLRTEGGDGEGDGKGSDGGGGGGGGGVCWLAPTTLHVQPAPRYEQASYATRRLEVCARDGTAVPLTLLWRRDRVTSEAGLPFDAPTHLCAPSTASSTNTAPSTAPSTSTSLPHCLPHQHHPLNHGRTGRTHCARRPASRTPHPAHRAPSAPRSRPAVDGYGAYGVCIDAHFSSARLSLVDRGVVYAIAHVRGGGEMGHHRWYETDGKYLRKRNSFRDFIDCAAALCERGITRPGALSCEGRSAGGLLVGGSINEAPHLFCAAVAAVPFVDLMVRIQ
jgi:protease II